MYKKLFESMYNGSLVTRGPWEALVTFQQMIILADKFGILDMTPEVLSTRTGIPLDIIKTGIKALERPDPESRSDELEGRRIDRLADNRSWGWRIVNFCYYDSLRRADERADYQARKYQERKQAKLNKSTTSKKVSTHSTPLNNSTHSTSHSHSHSHSQKNIYIPAENILDFLNQKTQKSFRAYNGTTPTASLKLILARFKEGYTDSDLRGVVAMKVRKWQNDPNMVEYLRPATLFGKEKFEQYVGEQEPETQEADNGMS